MHVQFATVSELSGACYRQKVAGGRLTNKVIPVHQLEHPALLRHARNAAHACMHESVTAGAGEERREQSAPASNDSS
jgi:hypothetical protein